MQRFDAEPTTPTPREYDIHTRRLCSENKSPLTAPPRPAGPSLPPSTVPRFPDSQTRVNFNGKGGRGIRACPRDYRPANALANFGGGNCTDLCGGGTRVRVERPNATAVYPRPAGGHGFKFRLGSESASVGRRGGGGWRPDDDFPNLGAPFPAPRRRRRRFFTAHAAIATTTGTCGWTSAV